MTLQDVARPISPAYAKAAGAADATRKAAHRTDKLDEWQRREEQHIAAGKQLKQRWRGMNVARRLAHQSGLHRDAEMARSEEGAGRVSAKLETVGIKRAALRDRLASEERVAAAALEEVRPTAERELAQRVADFWQRQLARGEQQRQETEQMTPRETMKPRQPRQ